MNFLDLAQRRYSVRKYADKVVEDEKIKQILESAVLAPSAVNYQPVHFIVVNEEKYKKQLIRSYPREWFEKAPVIIAACGNHETSWKRADGKDHCDIDVAIAVDHLTLAATSLGLGTCWVCNFDSDLAHSALGLPDYLEVVALIPLGYPLDDDVPSKKRKDFKDMVSYNRYK